MKPSDIKVGALVEISANGRTHRMYVVEAKDGVVYFRRTMRSRKGTWSLPFKFVMENGKVLRQEVQRATDQH